MAAFISAMLRSEFGLNAPVLSLDDLYLTLAERRELARMVHPLLLTRGVPGTHDVALGLEILDRLARLGSGESLALPRFDKANDDRAPEDTWPRVAGPVDVILLEGWCLGAEPQPAADLAAPINQLEAYEDSDGTWRRHVNARLEKDYPALWARIDLLVMLQAPSFAKVRAWRGEQERKLASALAASKATAIMDEAALDRFLMHYERLTRHMLQTMPEKADVLIAIGADRSLTWAKPAGNAPG
jgi:D-glycerate 3-kinase